MHLKRRTFIDLSVRTAGLGLLGGLSSFSEKIHLPSQTSLPAATPISTPERESRIAKAQQLLVTNNMKALILDCGTSMLYFTGIDWWPSERPMVAIIPANGDVRYVCPGFEEGRFRELITVGKEVYVWQEDESPYKQIVRALKDAGVQNGNIAIEERVRFFIMDGIRKEAPQVNCMSGDAVTIPCRMFKSPAEIALMQKAADSTIVAMKAGIASLREGMSSAEFAAVVDEAHHNLGARPDFSLGLFGEASAFPHGTTKPRKLMKGDIALMDCGCTVQGYSSDITRTIVFGAEPTKRQLEIWNLEKKAQSAGFAAAQLGRPCEDVDAAARKVITDAGFGPGYKLPGCSHRTGHGIGMEGHEPINLVHGEMTPLAPGMCFSNEPGIYIPGKFGIRLEDCFHMTATGPKWFSVPPKSLDEPFGHSGV